VRERFIGLAAMAILLWVAYHASELTTSAWRGVRPAAAAEVRAGSAREAAIVPDREVVVGHPRDGTRALPARRVRPASAPS